MKCRRYGRPWPLTLSLALLFGWLSVLSTDHATAHNNPGFKEVLLLTIEVDHQPRAGGPRGAHSEMFSLDLPKKTIELIWRIVDDTDADHADEGVIFSVAQGEKPHAEGLTNGANSRILRGGDIYITNVEGASAPFRLEVFANVIDRS